MNKTAEQDSQGWRHLEFKVSISRREPINQDAEAAAIMDALQEGEDIIMVSPASQSRTMTEEEIKQEAEKRYPFWDRPGKIGDSSKRLFNQGRESQREAFIAGAHLTNTSIQPGGMRWVKAEEVIPKDDKWPDKRWVTHFLGTYGSPQVELCDNKRIRELLADEYIHEVCWLDESGSDNESRLREALDESIVKIQVAMMAEDHSETLISILKAAMEQLNLAAEIVKLKQALKQ